jgi:hypothetical protein
MVIFKSGKSERWVRNSEITSVDIRNLSTDNKITIGIRMAALKVTAHASAKDESEARSIAVRILTDQDVELEVDKFSDNQSD